MKIESGSGIGLYRTGKPAGFHKKQGTTGAARTDIAEFSHSASPALAKEFSGVKSQAMTGFGKAADAGRIDALRQSVKEGGYHVPTGDIVRSILGE